MAELKNYQSLAVSELFNRIDLASANPNMMFRVAGEAFDEVVNGAVQWVDPTNPFVFLLQSSCIMAAANTQALVTTLRKQYPDLAQTQEDLYRHMSDNDYLGRFASAANTKATLVLQWEPLKSVMIFDAERGCSRATIPRDTTIVVDGVSFMMQYPVDIQLFNNGLLTVSYDANVTTPLFKLSTNEIQYRVNTDSSGVPWLMFQVDVVQCSVVVMEQTVQKSRKMSSDIPLTDSFLALRAFYKGSSGTGDWLEMNITHSDLVYDPFKPTACVAVYNDRVNVQIPTVYQANGLIEGVVRLYVYSTKGAIAYNFTSYGVDDFRVQLTALDEARDMTPYAAILARVSMHGLINQTVTGGANALSFEALRDKVISNSTGTPVIPITQAQAQTLVETHGFELIRNVDVVTDRIFLATQKLPDPSNKKLLTAANIGINTLMTTLTAIEGHPNVRINGKRWTLQSDALYIEENGVIRILQPLEIEALKNSPAQDLVTSVNYNRYLYSPFHYVLDSTDQEFTTRAYYLDAPLATDISFVRQNQTLQLIVNTASYFIEKINGGWKLYTTTQSGKFYKDLPDTLVSAQLAFYPPGQTKLAYINGVSEGKTDAGERIYSFLFASNFDIDNSDGIRITNARLEGISSFNIRSAIEQECFVFYTTSSLTSSFKPDDSDKYIGTEFLPPNSRAITMESIRVRLGLSLKNLWTRTRTLPTGITYKRYTQNIPKVYEKDVFDTNPVDGSMFEVLEGRLVYKKLHSCGEVVYDSENKVIYEHLIGDVELDPAGNPIILTLGQETKEVDMVFVDAKHYFATDPAFVDYRKEFADVLAEWITQDLQDIRAVLLEQTRIYFYPKNHLGMLEVILSDNQTARIETEQSFVIDLDVGANVYNSIEVRDQLQTNTILLLDNLISGTEVNVIAIKKALSDLYGNAVYSFSITGLGGILNLRYLKLQSGQDRLCLKRDLVLQQDGSLIIKEAVTLNFHLVN